MRINEWKPGMSAFGDLFIHQIHMGLFKLYQVRINFIIVAIRGPDNNYLVHIFLFYRNSLIGMRS